MQYFIFLKYIIRVTYFFLSFPLSATVKLKTYKANKKSLKGEEKRIDQLGSHGLKNTRVSSLSFLLALFIPDLEVIGNPETPMGTYNKSPPKTLISPVAAPRKRQPSKIENL